MQELSRKWVLVSEGGFSECPTLFFIIFPSFAVSLIPEWLLFIRSLNINCSMNFIVSVYFSYAGIDVSV